ncbi:META domain-containing protein [Marinomonas sp. GJ51-6]|uniref:META domain-containing protein n=1 Tax=Marinomonas sp. GJ51-6 TaxID=2992802 RepID=UPI0029346E33|nr:META domain-containing protein [Marinomonas sp. GJ51-6]WOD08730.1 META domain-containing protein [Marinomonas sp. GJ51-6]
MPKSMLLGALLVSIQLVGCSAISEGTDESTLAVLHEDLLSGSWQVEDIDQAGIIDSSMMTVEFGAEGRIAGFTGCNRYSANVDTEQGRFIVSEAVSTRRACVPAIGKQESRFLAALQDASRYEWQEHKGLVVYDANNEQRLKLVRMSPQDKPIDKGLSKINRYQCDQIGEVQFRFVEPETIELTASEQTRILQRQPTASGAQYTDDQVRFWNKGSEVMLSVAGVTYACEG